jgi:hypothetical protein
LAQVQGVQQQLAAALEQPVEQQLSAQAAEQQLASQAKVAELHDAGSENLQQQQQQLNAEQASRAA